EGVIKPDSVMNNKKRSFNGYSPDNYSARPEKVTVSEALVNSYNVASVEILNKLGVEKATKFLADCGITSLQKEDNNLALGLGGMTRGISPLQMAAAYTMFPNQGKQPGIHTVTRVLDAKNKVIYKDETVSQRLISSGSAKTMDGILKSVVNAGTGSNARVAIASGGKTGTTEGAAGKNTSRDLWYVGYTSELVTAVWVGNSDNAEIKGFGTYGGTVAGPVWKDYMNRLINQGLFKERPARQEDDKEEETVPIQPESSDQVGESAPDPTLPPSQTGNQDQTEPDDNADEGDGASDTSPGDAEKPDSGTEAGDPGAGQAQPPDTSSPSEDEAA
ncbi:MAG: penicillin-binding transpeptidase domain-containing protein, partial [Syntrophomonas sp.]|nr:penicillin-binding transpeptidase domain-containing protein [Syntrophomonas sp.]